MSWAGPSQGALYALKHTPQFTPVHLVLAPGVFIVNLLQYFPLVAKRAIASQGQACVHSCIQPSY